MTIDDRSIAVAVPSFQRKQKAHEAGKGTGPSVDKEQRVGKPAHQSVFVMVFGLLILGGSFAYSIHGLNRLHTRIEANRSFVDSLLVLSGFLKDEVEVKDREIQVLRSEKEALRKSLSRVSAAISGEGNPALERAVANSLPLLARVNLRGSVNPLASIDGDKRLYSFALWLEIPQEVRQEIQFVEYEFNHPAYRHERRRSSNLSDGFRIVYIGSECVRSVTVRLHTHGNEISSLDFDLCRAVGW